MQKPLITSKKVETNKNKCHIVGSLTKLKSSDVEQITMNRNFNGSNIMTFKKLYKNKMLYSSKYHQNNKKTASFIVKYIDNTDKYIGSIEQFIRVSNCTCKRICCCPAKHYAIICKLETINPFWIRSEGDTLSFIHECVHESNQITVTDIENLKYVCHYVHIENPNAKYVIEPANTLEFE